MPDERGIGRGRARLGLIVAGLAVSSAAGIVTGTLIVGQITPAYQGHAPGHRPWKAVSAPAEPSWSGEPSVASYAAVPAFGDYPESVPVGSASVPDEADRLERKADAAFRRWQAGINAEIGREQARMARQHVGADEVDRDGGAEAGPQGADATSGDAESGNGRELGGPEVETAGVAGAGPDDSAGRE